MDDVSGLVARQYEAYAYPEPFNDLAAKVAEGYCELGNPADYAALLWPAGRPRRPLKLLAAGCGTVQAAYLAYTNREAEVFGVDLSEASLAHERHLQDRHGLSNLRLFRGDLRDVRALGETFDAIVCSGVLHHLADPEAGLRALAGVLAPGGAMTLMLYGATARTGIYMVQDALRRLKVAQDATGVAFARRLVDQLPAQHFARWYTAAAAELQHDAAFVDTFLHPQDRAYTVPQLLDFLERNDLAFGGWVDNAHYHADLALARFSPEVRSAVAALPPREQWAVVEMLTLEVGMHVFVARHAANGALAVQAEALYAEGWERLVPHRAPGLRGTATAGAFVYARGGGAPMHLGQGQAALIEAIDGRRRIADLLTLPVLAPVPRAQRGPLVRDFVAQMWRLGHLFLAREPVDARPG